MINQGFGTALHISGGKHEEKQVIGGYNIDSNVSFTTDGTKYWVRPVLAEK